MAEANDSYFNAYTQAMSNYGLKVGLVWAKYNIDDKQNLTKLGTEYDVLVIEQYEDKAPTPTLYRNCLQAGLGGVADFSSTQLDAPTKPNRFNINKDDGTYVLLMCLDGKITKGLILSGLPHPNRKKYNSPYIQETNGIRTEIKEDGSLTITQKGKTDNNGIPAKALGSEIKFLADGSIELNINDLDPALLSNLITDKTKSTQQVAKNYIRINRATKAIEIGTEAALTIKAKDSTIEAETIDIKTSKSVKVTSDKANVDFKEFTIKVLKSLKIDAQEIKFNAQVMELKANQVTIKGSLIRIGNNPTPAITNQTLFIGTGNLGAPVVSQAIGPFSTSVFLG
jgi:hypothetical protein